MPATPPTEKLLGAICRGISEILDSNLTSLTDAAKGSVKNLSERMFSKALITEPVKNKCDLTMDDLLASIKSDIRQVKELPGLEETLEDFYNTLKDTGGPLRKAADRLQITIDEKIREVKSQHTKRAKSLPNGSKGHQSPQLSTSQSLPVFASNGRGDVTDHTPLSGISEHTSPEVDRSFSVTGGDLYTMESQQHNGNNSSPLHFTTPSGKSGILSTDPETSMMVFGSDKMEASRQPQCTEDQKVYTRLSSGYNTNHDTDEPSVPPPSHDVDDEVNGRRTGSCEQESVDFPTQVSRAGGRSPANGIVNHEHVNASSIKPPFGVSSCNRCKNYDERIMSEQRAKISTLELTVDHLQTQRDSRFEDEQKKLDIARDKLQDDRQLLEKRERDLDEDRRVYREERREEEERWKKRQEDIDDELLRKTKQLENDYLEKVKRIEREKTESMSEYKRKLNNEFKEKLQVETEKMKKEQRRNLGFNRSLSRERTKMEEVLTRAKQEKEAYVKLKNEEVATLVANIEKERSLLADEKKRVHQKEADLKKQQFKLDAKEISLVSETASFNNQRTNESNEMQKERQKIEKSRRELASKWDEYWIKEREIKKREKLVAKHEKMQQTTKSSYSDYKGIRRTSILVVLLLILVFVLTYSFITS